MVVVAGLTPEDEGEEYTGAGDRTSLSLSMASPGGKTQNNLITAVAALKKPMVVVLEGGASHRHALARASPRGGHGLVPRHGRGTALGKLLIGDANFSGKLPVTWPAAVADFPTFNGGGTTMMDYYLGYRYFDEGQEAPLSVWLRAELHEVYVRQPGGPCTRSARRCRQRAGRDDQQRHRQR